MEYKTLKDIFIRRNINLALNLCFNHLNGQYERSKLIDPCHDESTFQLLNRARIIGVLYRYYFYLEDVRKRIRNAHSCTLQQNNKRING